ncbi:MAG: LacI family transcriptional regulator [Victivallales bacterium]|jgi:DNA-binding LacI/PurR family transcriptional regulator|nr:LacI family transcriptional regulator [Victivallales bacterium]
MRVTLKDVAERTGVSRSVISMYLNGDCRVWLSDEKKRRIDAAVAELGYRPSATARALRNGNTRMLGMVVGGMTDPYFARLAEACLFYADKRGYQLLLSLTLWNPEKERTCLMSLIERQVGGIIYAPYPFFNEEFRHRLEKTGIPLVHFDEIYPHFLSVRKKTTAVTDAVKMLIRHGRREIACCAFNYGYVWQTIRDLGENHQIKTTLIDMEKQTKEQAVELLLKNRPEAVYCNSAVAQELVKQFQGTNYRPEIVTIYHFPFDLVTDECVTGVIVSNLYERARTAIELLIERIENKDDDFPSIRYAQNRFYERDEFLSIQSQLIDTLQKAEVSLP